MTVLDWIECTVLAQQHRAACAQASLDSPRACTFVASGTRSFPLAHSRRCYLARHARAAYGMRLLNLESQSPKPCASMSGR